MEVSLLPCIQVSLAAATLLDRARAEDDARWPTAVTWEREKARRAVRCGQAQELAERAAPPGERGVPLPTVEQSAAMDLANADGEVAARWRTDPQEAAALARKLTAGGELAAEEVLDEAVDPAVLTGCSWGAFGSLGLGAQAHRMPNGWSDCGSTFRCRPPWPPPLSLGGGTARHPRSRDDPAHPPVSRDPSPTKGAL
ncbi:hypothetical protein [Streptomyces sp. NPDC006971]|uniref:hypothetical protein n=1 Tax=Streptomyces sp. NPDC006971 TaxID=3154784 RepID=UPI0033EF57C4